jgi:hypothetical protein
MAPATAASGRRAELNGRDLVCWCAPLPCHGDVLLRLAADTRIFHDDATGRRWPVLTGPADPRANLCMVAVPSGSVGNVACQSRSDSSVLVGSKIKSTGRISWPELKCNCGSGGNDEDSRTYHGLGNTGCATGRLRKPRLRAADGQQDERRRRPVENRTGG